MTTDQLTAPESALIQWLADTVGLSREVEAELARRLAGLRAARSADEEAAIEALHRCYDVFSGLVYDNSLSKDYLRSISEQTHAAIRKAWPRGSVAEMRAPQPAAPAVDEAAVDALIDVAQESASDQSSVEELNAAIKALPEKRKAVLALMRSRASSGPAQDAPTSPPAVATPNHAKETMTDLREELSSILNRHSMENGSNTPDYILADYLGGCLAAFDNAVRMRALWYGRIDVPGNGSVEYKQIRAAGPQGGGE